MIRPLRVLALCLAGASLVLPAVPAAAQESHLNTYHANPVLIGAQIRTALALEQQAFTLLLAASTNADDLQRTKETVFDAYKMIRFAIGGVARAQTQKYPDPTLELQHELMEEARGHLRLCLEELERVAAGGGDRIQDAHARLLESFETLTTLLELLP